MESDGCVLADMLLRAMREMFGFGRTLEDRNAAVLAGARTKSPRSAVSIMVLYSYSAGSAMAVVNPDHEFVYNV